MKKIGNINNIPIVQGRNNEIKNQIKAEINIDGTLSFKKRNSLGELTPLTYIDVQGNNAKSRRKVGELFNKPLISSSTHLLKKKEILVQKSNEGIILGIRVNNGIKIISKNDSQPEYLCFTSTGDSTVKLNMTGSYVGFSKKSINYKINNGDWQKLDYNNVSLSDGDKMYINSDDIVPLIYKDELDDGNSYGISFAITGSIALSGDITSLYNFDNTTKIISKYEKLFKNCAAITDASNLKLPDTILSKECYMEMFYGCTSLTQPPTLPATTLSSYCYKDMFIGCASLTAAPELPATTLSSYCYMRMFYGCTSLTAAPELPATALTPSCYSNMFNGCTSLINAPALPATTLEAYCYNSMFQGCSSLTTAPELPATTLTNYCYFQMFTGCTKLNYVKAMFTDISATGCLDSWLTNVSPTGTFVKNAAATWTNEQAEIPAGWTVQTA